MRFLIAAVGKLKDEEERQICDRYLKRLRTTGKSIGFGPIETTELSESRAQSASQRKSEEAQRLLRATQSASFKIVLDEEGKSFRSEDFAKLLSHQIESGTRECAILIGGPDGHGREVLDCASVAISLGALTLPHGLARVVLVEQLYRAATILAGHPYHRA